MKWSRKFDSCTKCGTTEKRHMAKGLCVYCYLSSYHSLPANVERVKIQKRKHYLKVQKSKAQETRERRHFDGKRQSILIRDKFCCTCCGHSGTSRTLIVHHKDSHGRGSENPNNADENLVTLCRACHLAEHRETTLGARFKRGIDGWAREFTCCIDCGTTVTPHYSHGRCVNCRARFNRANNKDIV